MQNLRFYAQDVCQRKRERDREQGTLLNNGLNPSPFSNISATRPLHRHNSYNFFLLLSRTASASWVQRLKVAAATLWTNTFCVKTAMLRGYKLSQPRWPRISEEWRREGLKEREREGGRRKRGREKERSTDLWGVEEGGTEGERERWREGERKRGVREATMDVLEGGETGMLGRHRNKLNLETKESDIIY